MSALLANELTVRTGAGLARSGAGGTGPTSSGLPQPYESCTRLTTAAELPILARIVHVTVVAAIGVNQRPTGEPATAGMDDDWQRQPEAACRESSTSSSSDVSRWP